MQNTCCHGTGIETNTHTLNNYLRGPCGKQTTSKELRCVLLKVTQCLWAEPEGIITARALGNQHMRTVCSPCAQSTPITSARHMKPPLLQRDRDPHRQSEDHRQREAKMDVLSFLQFISQACVFHQSSFPFPFYSDSELPQIHTYYSLQVCVVTAPPKHTALAMLGTFKYIIFL